MEITVRIQEQIQARRKWRARSYRKRCKVGTSEKSGYSRQGNARKERLVHTAKMAGGHRAFSAGWW